MGNKEFSAAVEDYQAATLAYIDQKVKFQKAFEKVMNVEGDNESVFPTDFCNSFHRFNQEEVDMFRIHTSSFIEPLLDFLRQSRVEIDHLRKEKKKLKKHGNEKIPDKKPENEHRVYLQIKGFVVEQKWMIFSHALSFVSSQDQYLNNAIKGKKGLMELLEPAVDIMSTFFEEAKSALEDEKEEYSIIRATDMIDMGTIKLEKAASNVPDFERIPGEGLIQRVDNVILLSQINTKHVSVFVTTYRLVLKSAQVNDVDDASRVLKASETVLEAPLLSIWRFDRLEEHPELGLVQILCKDLRQFVLSFACADTSSSSFCSNISPFIFANPDREIFAFFNRQKFSRQGWDVYSFEKEISRLGLPNGNFGVFPVNIGYKLAPTYPQSVVCPSRITCDVLREASSFRSKHRVIAVCWVDPTGYRALARSAQPLSGIGRSRNQKDEEILLEMERLASVAPDRGVGNPERHNLIVADARPKVNAMANLAKGGGWENLDDLPMHIDFLGIDNIHVVREALSGLRKQFGNYTLVNQSGGTFKTTSGTFSSMNPVSWISTYRNILSDARREAKTNSETGQWFKLLSTLLKGAVHVAKSIIFDKVSVLVHCSDGWDRTAQLVALASLMMDPYYRTMEGFAVLIEKEWLSYGHKFAERHGHALKNRSKFSDKQRSPVFLQFMDACFQIMSQRPEAFEFNAFYLVEILDSLYSGKYGTFLGNSEMDRSKMNVHESTPSVWSEFLDDSYRQKFVNEFFDPAEDVILPYTAPGDLTLFLHYFIRWNQATFSNCENDARMILNSWETSMSPAKVQDPEAEWLKNSDGKIIKIKSDSEFS